MVRSPVTVGVGIDPSACVTVRGRHGCVGLSYGPCSETTVGKRDKAARDSVESSVGATQVLSCQDLSFWFFSLFCLLLPPRPRNAAVISRPFSPAWRAMRRPQAFRAASLTRPLPG